MSTKVIMLFTGLIKEKAIEKFIFFNSRLICFEFDTKMSAVVNILLLSLGSDKTHSTKDAVDLYLLLLAKQKNQAEMNELNVILSETECTQRPEVLCTVRCKGRPPHWDYYPLCLNSLIWLYDVQLMKSKEAEILERRRADREGLGPFPSHWEISAVCQFDWHITEKQSAIVEALDFLIGFLSQSCRLVSYVNMLQRKTPLPWLEPYRSMKLNEQLQIHFIVVSYHLNEDYW